MAAQTQIKHEVVVVKHKSTELNFTSKSTAFDHFFIAYLNAGMDDCEAAEKAERVSTAIAKAKGLPDCEADTMTKIFTNLEKLTDKAKDHPKIVEFVAGLATGLVGAKAMDSSSNSEPKFDVNKSNINLDEIE